ncbi:MAG: Gfo/Idh/MocA family oxidoreductase [Schleiferiaceae bacterium]|nr:Gfo/Idh/MocA family oxidoreductase [Schleiferiaceae bacterium]
MNVLIYGFGRMGLTHFSILNGLDSRIKFTIVEPSRLLRFFLKKNIGAKFSGSDRHLTTPFDLTLVTTPPSSHVSLVNKALCRGDKRIFVEKPFGGHSNLLALPEGSNDKVNIGYVLRFNPCIQWLKKNVEIASIKSIHGQYLSNTIAKKPKGWRNGSFSGVLNEMGSHVVDLIYYLIGNEELEIVSTEKQSLVSDIDDVVKAKLKSESGIFISLYFNWVKKEIRKPIFSLRVIMNDDSYFSLDQQRIEIYDSDGKIEGKILITDLAATVPFYVRGVDFTKQMSDLLVEQTTMANANDAVKVNQLMKNILDHEDNLG